MNHLVQKLLAHEGHGAESAEDRAAAAGRVCAKFFERLATLLGQSGALAIFSRSMTLTAREFPCLDRIDLASQREESPAEELASCLRMQMPDDVTKIAVALFARWLALLATLIGKQLTLQSVRGAWPAVDLGSPNEETA